MSGILCAGACRQPCAAGGGAERVRAPGPTTEQLWDMANTAYINGNFHSAAEVYEEILSRGVSSVKLYYNLANAYFKEDRIGKAILYYKRALRLAPATTTSATT